MKTDDTAALRKSRPIIQRRIVAVACGQHNQENVLVTTRNDPAAPSDPDKAVEVALAEFSALRSEIDSGATARAALVGVGLTALGVLFGLVIREGGDERLLLAVPPLVLAISLLNTAGNYRAALIGGYIRDKLWPYLEERVGGLPSWEKECARRRRSPRAIPVIVLTEFPAMALFIFASIAALLVVGNDEPELRAVGVILTVLAIVVPAGFGVGISRMAHSKGGSSARQDSKDKPELRARV